MDLLIDRLKRKDRDAWATVYEECADAVFRHALYRLRADRPVAEDVTQEVFLRAIEAIGSFEGERSGLLRWLRGISRRIIARRRRGLSPAAARPLSLDNPEAGAHSNDVADARPLANERLIAREEQHLTATALTALPERWESALRWKYSDGLSVAEIARRLRISPKAAESLLSRARAAFKAVYTQFVQSDGRLCEIEEVRDE